MKTIIIVVAFLIIYVVSGVGLYKFYQNLFYNPKSWNYGNKPELKHAIVIFVPIFNTIIYIALITVGWRDDEYKKKSNFFKPKNNKT